MLALETQVLETGSKLHYSKQLRLLSGIAWGRCTATWPCRLLTNTGEPPEQDTAPSTHPCLQQCCQARGTRRRPGPSHPSAADCSTPIGPGGTKASPSWKLCSEMGAASCQKTIPSCGRHKGSLLWLKRFLPRPPALLCAEKWPRWSLVRPGCRRCHH